MKTGLTGTTGAQRIVTDEFVPLSSNTEAKSEKVQQPQTTAANVKGSQENAASRRNEAVLESRLRQAQIQNTGLQWTGGLKLNGGSVKPPISEVCEQMQSLYKNLQSLSWQEPIIDSQRLQEILTSLQDSSVPPDMDASNALDILGISDEAKQVLFDGLAGATEHPTNMDPETAESYKQIINLIASLLAGLQGRAGQGPLGFPPGSFGIPAAPQRPNEKQNGQAKDETTAATSGSTSQERAQQAKELVESGALGTGEKKKEEHPEVSEQERKGINDLIAKADDDAAESLSHNQHAMAVATPEQKAKLINAMMSGHTSDKEDQAIARILGSCTTKAEYDKVMELCGGAGKIFGELDDDGAKNALRGTADKWNKQQQEATTKAVSLIEQCETPEEAKELAAQLGATDLKHQIKDPELLKRLDAVAKRFDMPALGYGLPPETVQQKRAQLNQAYEKEDSDLAVKLSEDKDAMNVASPAEKAKLIRELQRGWTKDSQDVAIYKILLSCNSKAEFDEVVQLAGGEAVLKDMDHEETRVKMDKLFGAWGRVDLADDKNRAEQFKDVLTDPEKQKKYSATRPPTDGEVNQVGGSMNIDSQDASNPEMQQAQQAAGVVKKDIQKKAFDINWEPQAKNELVLEQRSREIDGRPALDWTALTAEADKITSAPDFDKKVADFQKQYNDSASDDIDINEAREKYVTLHMQQIAKKYGLSEQTMKQLVTQRMGQIYKEGAGEMGAYSQAIVAPLKKQLAQIEMTKGPNSPEAIALRERIAKLESTTGAYTNRLGTTGDVYSKMFPVPKSFAEDFVSSFSFIGDIAAAVASCIPGVGQVIGGIYFGVKAITAAAKGDIMGMFSSVASAIPGLGAAIGGAAGAAINTGSRLVQTGIGVGRGIAEGNVLGVFGSVAGVGSSPFFEYAQKGFQMADGISRGDFAAVAGAAGGILGPVANDPAIQEIIRNPIVQQASAVTEKAAPFFNAIANGDASQMFGAFANELSPFAAVNPEARRALGMIQDGAGFINAIGTGEYGNVMREAGAALDRIGNGPDAEAVSSSLQQVSSFVMALGSGNSQELANVLGGGFLEQIGEGNLSDALTKISGLTNDLITTPEFQSGMDLTESGARFFSSIANGDLLNTLNNVSNLNQPLSAGARQLREMLSAVQSLLQSMLRGDFQRAAEELGKNERTSSIADQLLRFEPLAFLSQQGSQILLKKQLANFNQIANLGDQLGPIQNLEQSTRQLQDRFGKDVNGMAQMLLDRSGVQTTLPLQNPAQYQTKKTEYPGVYLQEVPTGLRTIPGVSTSNSNVITRPAPSVISENFQRKPNGLLIDSTAARMAEVRFADRLKQSQIQEPVVGGGSPQPEDSVSPNETTNNDQPSGNSSELKSNEDKKSTNVDLDGQKKVTPAPVHGLAIDIQTDPSFQKLPAATKKQLLSDISKDPAAAANLQQIVSHPQWALMDEGQRTKVLNVFANLGPKGKAEMTGLMNRQIVIGTGEPPVRGYALVSTDNANPPSSLLDNLNKMVDQPLSPAYANRRKELMLDVISQTARPSWNLSQGIVGTCASTTVQEHVLRHSPAEYARIIGGLASPAQSVTLADGSKLDAAKNQNGSKVTINIAPPPGKPEKWALVDDGRSISERMFQSALQQRGNRFDQKNPKYVFDASNSHDYGMWDDATADVMKGIYNQKFESYPPGANGISNKTDDEYERSKMRSELYGKVENELNAHNGPVAVHVIWGGTDAKGNPNGLHEVEIEKIENGRVYFRNPWGSAKAYQSRGQQPPSNGDVFNDPPARRVEDNTTGLESMSIQEFQNVLNGATLGPPVGRP